MNKTCRTNKTSKTNKISKITEEISQVNNLQVSHSKILNKKTTNDMINFK
jgi:hypothetical protein